MAKIKLIAIRSVRLFADLPLLYMFWFLHFTKPGTGGGREMLLNVMGVVAFGAIHSLLARERSKRLIARWVGEHGVRLVFVVTVGTSLTMLLHLWRPLAGIVWRTDGVGYVLVTGVYLLALGCIVHAASSIDYSEFLGIRPALRALRNKPAKEPVFSVKGWYAHTRHPMYFFMLVALWAAPVMTYTRFEFALLMSVYLFLGTKFEERNLREELGEVYDEYCRNVPMWIPSLKPWRNPSETHAQPEGG
jgi:protein-S-isoprenylcysteine O-methyltransferase Ste14